MNCPNCEKEIANGVAQCPHCGCHFAVKAIPKPAPKPVPPPPPVVTEQPKAAPEPPEPLEAPPSENKVAVAEENCPHCGNVIAWNATFCKWCGLRVVQQETATPVPTPPPSTKFCKNCGKSISATATFCKWCGA